MGLNKLNTSRSCGTGSPGKPKACQSLSPYKNSSSFLQESRWTVSGRILISYYHILHSTEILPSTLNIPDIHYKINPILYIAGKTQVEFIVPTDIHIGFTCKMQVKILNLKEKLLFSFFFFLLHFHVLKVLRAVLIIYTDG